MTTKTISYYFAPQSPWTYLGHARFAAIAEAAGATVLLRPVDLGGKVFPVSGGLPLGQRAPQRQAYRLLELRRFATYLNVPLNIKPMYFPVGGDDAARLIISVDQHDGTASAMRLTHAILSAVWAQERNIGDDKTLMQLLEECGLAPARLAQSQGEAAQSLYEKFTESAIEAGVFGAPSYVLDGEIFWGQDRLDFLERKLKQE